MNDNDGLAIACRGVRKTYPHFVLDSIDLEVEKGTVMGFVGPNGAGKSTTLRILLGLIHQDEGTVQVLGHNMPEEQVAAKWDVGFYSEDMRLHPARSVAFHMRFMASVFPSWDQDYAIELLERFGIPATQRFKRLSHGQRVKATMLMALARHPRLLVLDEPTTGLDPIARRQVLQEMSAVRADVERTILFSSHNTLDVEQISDHITCIHRGRVVFSQDKETLLDSWRRLRLQVPDGYELPALPGTWESERSGHIAQVTTSAWSESFVERLGAVEVKAVDRMTLEEILVASNPSELGLAGTEQRLLEAS